MQLFEVGFGVVACIRRNQGLRRAIRLGALYHRQQDFLLAARAQGGGGHNNLMLAVDGGNTGEALDHAFGGRHFGAVIVRRVAFTNRAFTRAAFLMLGQKGADARGFSGEFLGALHIKLVVLDCVGFIAALVRGEIVATAASMRSAWRASSAWVPLRSWRHCWAA